MANDRTDILFPVGRLIMGSCYKGSDKDSKGNPRVVKSGPNKGQPVTQFFLGVAIPKAGEQAWWQTTWGQQIMAVGAAAFPNFYQNPAFAWKIDDGDSTIPNKSNRRPCDSEGAPGHWILKFSSNFAPKVFQQPTPGTFVEVTTPDAVKTGYWVQISGSVAGNGSAESPGVYLNHGMVLFAKVDAEIKSGPDAATAFAGAVVSQALPGAGAMPFAAAPGGAPTMPGAAPAMGAPAMPGAAPVMVQPNPGFLGGPAMPGAMPAPGMPVAPAMPAGPAMPAAPAAVPAGPVLTPAGAASGFTYAQYRSSGWSDDQLRANGLIA